MVQILFAVVCKELFYQGISCKICSATSRRSWYFTSTRCNSQGGSSKQNLTKIVKSFKTLRNTSSIHLNIYKAHNINSSTLNTTMWFKTRTFTVLNLSEFKVLRLLEEFLPLIFKTCLCPNDPYFLCCNKGDICMQTTQAKNKTTKFLPL